MIHSLSGPLIEKTNREGFVQNAAFEHFVVLLEFILGQFAAERQSDRRKWLLLNKKPTANSFQLQISEFKQLIYSDDLPEKEKQQKLLEEAEKMEERYQEDRDTLLIPAGVGMTASFAMHEIEKLVPRMEDAVSEKPFDIDKITNQVAELKDYTDGILSVLEGGGQDRVCQGSCTTGH